MMHVQRAEGIQRIAVEDLPAHLATLEGELSGGRLIEIVRGHKVIAELHEKKEAAFDPATRVIPDYFARMKAIFGDEIVDSDSTEIIREDRDARG